MDSGLETVSLPWRWRLTPGMRSPSLASLRPSEQRTSLSAYTSRHPSPASSVYQALLRPSADHAPDRNSRINESYEQASSPRVRTSELAPHASLLQIYPSTWVQNHKNVAPRENSVRSLRSIASSLLK